MEYWQHKRAVVTGASSGLGRALAELLVDRGARVAIVARGQDSLDRTVAELAAPSNEVFAVSADVTDQADMERLAATARDRLGGVDFFCHCAGKSTRGDVLATSPDEFRDLWELNFLAAVRGVQRFADALVESRGHIVLVSSLAGKTAPRYLGAYPASKFPLTALAQQLRQELGPRGVHTLLVCPGTVARPDANSRHADQADGLPASAQRAGGGAKIKAIDPVTLAKRILTACERRQPELILPAKARLLFLLSQLSPGLGDWLLKKNMGDD